MPVARLLFVSFLLLLFSITPCAATEETHLATAEELLILIGTDKLIETAKVKIHESYNREMNSNDVSDEKRAVYDEYREKVLALLEEKYSWASLKGEIAALYLRAFDEDELREIVQFYATPTGRKVLETMPLLREETLTIADHRFGRVLPRILELKSEMEARLQALPTGESPVAVGDGPSAPTEQGNFVPEDGTVSMAEESRKEGAPRCPSAEP
jgi:uncharacterized protein